MTLTLDVPTVLFAMGVACTVASALMVRMLPLRIIAVVGNLAFLVCAMALLWAPSPPGLTVILALLASVALLAVNAWRALEITRLTVDVNRLTRDSPVSEWLLSHMQVRPFAAGEILFRKGDRADRLMYVHEGELLLTEIGKRVRPGELLGELGLFSPDNQRFLTLQAETAGEVYEMTGDMLFQLYYQDPKLGFYMMRLLATRTLEIEAHRKDLKLESVRVESELDSAREIQLNLVPVDYPAPTPERPVEIFALLLPARQVGGDLYDFFYIDARTLCLAVADVSDKGVPAALFMAHTRSMLRAVASMLSRTEGAGAGPAQVLARVNEELCPGNRTCMFVTVFFAMLDLDSNELSFCNAGHNVAYVIDAAGRVVRLEAPRAKPLGIRATFPYLAGSRKLAPGETLFIYTDGITEAMNEAGDLFEAERLESSLERAAHTGPRQIVESVVADVRAFAGAAAQSDDIAAMAVRLVRTAVDAPMTSACTRIAIGSRQEELPRAVEVLDGFARSHGVVEDDLADLQVALDEVLANLVQHAYPEGGSHEIRIEFRIADGALEATIEDDGVAFDPLAHATPDTKAPLHQRREGGLGIHLVRNLMDHVAYERAGDRNRLSFRKNLKASGELIDGRP